MLGSFFQTYSLNMKLFSFRFHQLWWPALWHAQCALPSFTEFFPRTRTRREKMSKKKKEEKGNGPEWTEFRIRCTFFSTLIVRALIRSMRITEFYRVCPRTRTRREKMSLKKKEEKGNRTEWTEFRIRCNFFLYGNHFFSMIFFLPRRHVAKDGRSRQLLLPLPKTAVTSGPSLGPKKKGQSTFFFRCCCCCCCCSRGGEIKKREKWEIFLKNVKKRNFSFSPEHVFQLSESTLRWWWQRRRRHLRRNLSVRIRGRTLGFTFPDFDVRFTGFKKIYIFFYRVFHSGEKRASEEFLCHRVDISSTAVGVSVFIEKGSRVGGVPTFFCAVLLFSREDRARAPLIIAARPLH